MPSPPDDTNQPDGVSRDRWHWAVTGALLALAFLFGSFPMADFDPWWHLRTGQFILEHRAVPQVDIYTYTNAGAPWIDVYWLFQVVIALLHRVGGVSALVGLKVVVGVAIVGWSLAARRPGAASWPAVLVWLPGLVVLSGRLNERPELFSLLLLAGFLLVFGRIQDWPWGLWLLPLLQLLWVNSHGFFVLGPLIVVAYGADLLVCRVRGIALPPRLARNFALAGGAVCVACLINPYGGRVFRLPIQQFHKLGAGIYRTHIGELKSISDFISLAGMKNPYLLALLFMFALGIASFAWALARGRFSLFRGLLFAGSAYLGWQATRNSALFALVVAVVTLWNLDDRIEQKQPVLPAPRRGRRGPRPKVRRRLEPFLLLAIALTATAVLSGGLYAWAGEGRTMGFGERKQWYAHESCAFLARPGMPERMVAFNLGQAGVCIAHTGEQRKQFLDPRLEVSSPETFERYLAGLRGLWRGGPDWEAALAIDRSRPDQIPALLIERGVLSRVIEVLMHDPRWLCVHADSVAAVFVDAGFAEAHGLPAVRP